MRLIRTIMGALVAISVAMSPAIAEELLMSPSQVEVMTMHQANMPCCPCCDKQDNLKSTACVLKCMTLTGALIAAPSAAQLYLHDGHLLPFVHDASHGIARKPPTHPPPA